MMPVQTGCYNEGEADRHRALFTALQFFNQFKHIVNSYFLTQLDIRPKEKVG